MPKTLPISTKEKTERDAIRKALNETEAPTQAEITRGKSRSSSSQPAMVDQRRQQKPRAQTR